MCSCDKIHVFPSHITQEVSVSDSNHYLTFSGDPAVCGRAEIGEGRGQGQREGHCPFTYPHDFGVALGTDWGKELLIAPFTVHVVLFLHKAPICQRGLAIGTVEFLWVPGTAHGYQEGAPGEAENRS